MRVDEAKTLVLDLIRRDIESTGIRATVDPNSPDGDVTKFMLQGRPARAIHYRDGYYVKINLDWFDGSNNPPVVNDGTFYWYVFAIPAKGAHKNPHYFICDYQTLKRWVLEFDAPLGKDHRDHNYWRSDIHVVDTTNDNRLRAWFRWGDEPKTPSASREFILDNIGDVVQDDRPPRFAGAGAEGGAAGENALRVFTALEQEQRARAEAEEAFEPYNIIDARERIVAQIVRRRGQPQFRRALIEAYRGRCVISGCETEEALEAAHIVPYRGPETNAVTNGLLLRADLHTLFDLGLITVDAATMTVIIDQRLRTGEYGRYMGTRITPPARPETAPSIEALEAHRRFSSM